MSGTKGLSLGLWGLVALVISTAAWAAETRVSVLIVYPAAGHASVHLQRDGQQLYWDPGGSYGTELDDCLEAHDPTKQTYCQRFAGFPWAGIRTERRNDVLVGPMADLMRVLSIYHLDGDTRIEVFDFSLTGDAAKSAWHMLRAGAQHGASAGFETDRLTLTCTKAVSEYLDRLGGEFTGIERPWLPEDLSQVLKARGMSPTRVYTFDHPEVQAYIAAVRAQAGQEPLPAGCKPNVPHSCSNL